MTFAIVAISIMLSAITMGHPLMGIFMFAIYKADGGKMKFLPYMRQYFKYN